MHRGGGRSIQNFWAVQLAIAKLLVAFPCSIVLSLGSIEKVYFFNQYVDTGNSISINTYFPSTGLLLLFNKSLATLAA